MIINGKGSLCHAGFVNSFYESNTAQDQHKLIMEVIIMATIAEQIQELYIGLLGRAGEKAGVDYWTDEINQNKITIEGVRENTVRYQPEYQNGLGSLDRGAALNELYNRMFQRDPDADGFTYWAEGGGKTVPFDKLILALSNGAQAADRTILDNKSEAAQFYTDNTPVDNYTAEGAIAAISSVDGTTASVEASKAKTLSAIDNKGDTKTLTITSETLSGTEKNDTFLASASDTSANTDTFNAGDTIDGLGGADALNLTVSGTNNANTVAAADISNIETINVRAVLTSSNTATTVQANNFVGATDFYADRATSAVTFSALATGQSAGIKSNGTIANGDLNINYSNSVTTGTINITGGTTQGVITQSGTGITSNTLNSMGTVANVLSNISLSGSGNTALTINAAASIDSGNITGFTGTNASIVISGAANNLAPTTTDEASSAVNIGTVQATAVKSIDASGLTVGGLGAILSNNATIVVKGGAGNDSIMTGVALTTGSVDAGSGANDLLAVANSAHLSTSGLGAKYTNFEVLRVIDGVSVDMDNISGITAVELMDGASNSTGFTDLSAAQAGAIKVLSANGRMETSVKGAATNGQLDVVTMTFDNGNTTAREDINTSASTIVSQDVETFNFIATDHIEIGNTQQMSDWTTINFSGGGDIDFTTGNQTILVNSVINSTTTGNVSIDAQDSSSFGINLTTGSGDDTIKMANTDLADIINSGEGDDTIYANGSGTTGNDGDNLSSDTITTGTGLDTIHLSLGGGSNPSNIDSITDLDFGTLNSVCDTLVFRGIGSATTEVIVAVSATNQANIDAQSSLQNAANFVLNNIATNDGNVSQFSYASEAYLIVNGDGNGSYSGSSDALVKITGVTGGLDTADFIFT